MYGHNTKCLKDIFYTVLSGTHYHLADVVDKPEHARKRKVLSSAYALKNLEKWEHKVADKTERLIRGFDARCTAPLPKEYTRPNPKDLTVDYRSWTNFFTLDAIADIGLSERLGFLDAGNDKVVAERMDGSLHEVNYRDCLHATARAQSGLVWAYEWYPQLQKISSIMSKQYRKMWKLNKDWNDIALHRATRRLKKYQAGEKLDDFFTALMEDKEGNPNNLEWGEIVAEISIMMNAGSGTHHTLPQLSPPPTYPDPKLTPLPTHRHNRHRDEQRNVLPPQKPPLSHPPPRRTRLRPLPHRSHRPLRQSPPPPLPPRLPRRSNAPPPTLHFRPPPPHTPRGNHHPRRIRLRQHLRLHLRVRRSPRSHRVSRPRDVPSRALVGGGRERDATLLHHFQCGGEGLYWEEHLVPGTDGVAL